MVTNHTVPWGFVVFTSIKVEIYFFYIGLFIASQGVFTMGAILHYFSKLYRTILIVLGIRVGIFSKPVSLVVFLNMLENLLTCTVSNSTEFTKHFLTIYMTSSDPMSLKNGLCSGIERTNRARIIMSI